MKSICLSPTRSTSLAPPGVRRKRTPSTANCKSRFGGSDGRFHQFREPNETMTTPRFASARPRPGQMPPVAAAPEPRLQRKCACGGIPGTSGECESCRRKRLGLQRRHLYSLGTVNEYQTSSTSRLHLEESDGREAEAKAIAEQVVSVTGDQHRRTPGAILPNVTPSRDEMQCRVNPGKASKESDVPRIVGEVLGTPGEPLEFSTRNFMEERFGHDFSQVRVHTDARA